MTIKTVLIANRGEIAVRVIRAAADAGIRSIAVYADDDADALHVRLADEAYALNGRSAADSYLNIDTLIKVALISGADAVHPGYGFLSERSDFAEAVISAGLIWIGPDPATITLLGNKARARELAAEVGAPLVPGTQGAVAGPDDVEAFVAQHGLPIAIKAVFGGGGRGMRVVHDSEEIRSAYESAVRESVGAFGRGDCLVERFLERPRHIEVQVLGDKHGRIVALGTRDCSLQRRNQKLVEEAPAPFLEDTLRERLETSAVNICAAAGYVGAGTVEFLLSEDGIASFLEVNTRLQVEHPVTEMVTGIDLVREQFRIAAGEPMSVPETASMHGHAIEFRINAEDPALGYLPTPGLIQSLSIPQGPGVRFDSGVYEGYVVPGSFDSLLAKLIVWGRDREEAISRARRALRELKVEGVATVIPFAEHVINDSAFVSNAEGFNVHTRWIEEDCTAEFTPAAAVPVPGDPRLKRLSIEVDGRLVELGLPESLLARLSENSGTFVREPEVEHLKADVEVTRPAGALQTAFAGTLGAWKITDGATVQIGDTVAIIEAMKMESPVRAPVAGTLRHGSVVGQQLGANEVFGQIEAEA